MPRAFPSDLPFDVTELVLDNIESHRDLVSFAATSTALKDLIIPRYTEYRVLRVVNTTLCRDIWAHLAQRPDLARYIREVTIRESSPDQIRGRYLLPQRFPVTLVKPTPHSTPEADAALISQALRNMTNLGSFTWVGPWEQQGLYRNVPNHHRDVFQTLKEIKSLVKLSIVDLRMFEDPDVALTQAEDYPLWNITHIQDLSLSQFTWWPRSLSHWFSQSFRLQSLKLRAPVDPVIFQSCRFPQLRSLELTATGRFGDDGERAVAEFVQRHSTIEDLTWYPFDKELRLAPGSLPVLKRIVSGPEFACSIISDPAVALECVSQLRIDQATLEVLSAANTTCLRDFRCWSYPDLATIHRLAELVPHATRLEVPKFGIATRSDENNDYSVDDYIRALARFPKLEILLDSSLWPLVLLGGEDKIRSLITLCPKLQRLGHYSSRKEAFVEIVLNRDGERPSWTEEISHEED